MKVNEKNIEKIMTMFNHEFPTKFMLTPERIEVWSLMLRDFDDETVLTASYHLASILDWPPTIAQVREQCILIDSGKLTDPTGSEAWERIWRRIGGEEVEFTDLEKKTLRQTSSIYDLKRSKNPSTDRAHFIKAFEQLVAERKLKRQTLPEVRALVEKNRAPLLPAKGAK